MKNKQFVTNREQLPADNNELNDRRVVLSEPAQYEWNGSEWVKVKDLDLGVKSKYLFG